MISNEQTILEGPETPAPVFAYRAFRSYFLGSPSPEASPDRHPRLAEKENIPMAKSSSSAPKPDPSKVLNITTHKRDTANNKTVASGLVSPAKGILKTPGSVQSPYKNRSVKFDRISPDTLESQDLNMGPLFSKRDGESGRSASKKDTESPSQAMSFSRSLSVVARDIPTSQPANKRHSSSSIPSSSKPTSTTRRTSTPVSSSTRREHDRQQTSNIAGPTPETPTGDPSTIPYSAFLHFKETTEQETKKLIRYNRKMRDYARDRDAECGDARMTIERLQMENEMLKTANKRLKNDARLRQDSNGGRGDHTEGEVAIENIELKQKTLDLEERERVLKLELKKFKTKAKELERLLGSQAQHGHRSQSSNMEDQASTKRRGHSEDHRRHKSPSAQDGHIELDIHHGNHDEGEHFNQQHQKPVAATLPRLHSHSHSHSHSYHHDHRRSSAPRPQSHSHQSSSSHQTKDPTTTPSTPKADTAKMTTSGNANMDASRAAAARERLRLRSESRKASGGGGGADVGDDQRDGHRDKERESQLDWENL